MVLDMELAPTLIPRKELSMKELGWMECVTVTVNFVIKTAQYTKEIGEKVWNGVKAEWLTQLEITMKETGKIIKETVMV